MNTLYYEIQNLINDNKEAKLFLNDLLDISYVYLFGGGVRDYLDNNFQNIRDFDFVINSKNNDYINIENYISKFKTIKYHKNRFGGYKINFNGLIFDIWNLKDTWLFKVGYKKPSINNLINSVYLNLDSLIYLLNENIYINDCDKTYKMIIKHKTIDIVCNKTPCEELNLLRALVFKKRYAFNLSDKIKAKFSEHTENNINFRKQLIKLQKEHYNTSIFSFNDIDNEISEMLTSK